MKDGSIERRLKALELASRRNRIEVRVFIHRSHFDNQPDEPSEREIYWRILSADPGITIYGQIFPEDLTDEEWEQHCGAGNDDYRERTAHKSSSVVIDREA